MLIEIILALLLGVASGTITGLIPGIHINLLGVFILTISTTILAGIETNSLVIFLVAMSITHTFVDFIPSVFLGCPDTDTELSVLPGHELLKIGQGYQAVLLTCYGSLAAIFILILISIPSITLISQTYYAIKQFIPYFLIIASASLILLEKRKFPALVAFSLSGFLGLCVLNLQNLNQPLLPLLTGLFGSSMLIISIKNKIQIPEQKIVRTRANLLKPLLGSLVASPLCSFLPGLGSGQAAIIGNTISNRQKDKKGFLILLGATNTLVMGFSFIALYTISKTRTGIAAAIKKLLPTLSYNNLIMILAAVFFSGIISFFITKLLAKTISQKITKINYTKISITTLTFLFIIIFAVSGPSGLIILILATTTGLYCISLKVRRTQMMGCLLLPTILLYLL